MRAGPTLAQQEGGPVLPCPLMGLPTAPASQADFSFVPTTSEEARLLEDGGLPSLYLLRGVEAGAAGVPPCGRPPGLEQGSGRAGARRRGEATS